MDILWKYRSLFGRYWGSLLVGVLTLAATRALAVWVPLLVRNGVETLQKMSESLGDASSLAIDEDSLHRTLLTMVAVAIGMFSTRVLSRKYLLSVGKRIEYDLRNRLYGHLLTMPSSFFRIHPTGELMSRMTSDVEATRFIPGGGVMLGLNTLLAYVLTIPMMLSISPVLTLVTFVTYPVAIFVMTRLSARVKVAYHAVQGDLAEISTVAQENLSGMAVIQAYAKEPSENVRFERLCDIYLGAYQGLVKERLLLFSLLAALSGFSLLVILWLGGSQIIGGTLDLGGFIAYTLYVEQLAWPTMALGWTISVFQQGAASLERIDTVLSQPPAYAADYAAAVPEAPAPVAGKIEIRHLHFAYDNPYRALQTAVPDAKTVLHDINLTIQPGETIALVGPVGAGKSTLLRLLPRMEAPPTGSIFLDGRDITTMNPADLRAAMVFMPQVSFLFSTSVSQNIAFGRPHAARRPEEEIVPIARAAGVHQDVLGLPEQYDTLVGELGIMLSGGQRQRVSLARALMLEAPILILDDPFSNVDAETERMIIAALEERHLFRNRTTLFATHRFSLVRQADRVVLMDAGRIVAIGPHEELLRTQSLYQKLNRLETLRHEFESKPEEGASADFEEMDA